MQKIGLALLLGLLGLAPAQSQVAGWPPPAGALAALCVYNSSPPTLSATNVGFVQCDASGNLRISGTVTTTLAGTTSNASSAVATSATNIPAVSYNYLFNGTTWDQARETVGDAQAAAGLLANVPSLFNGTTYDRSRSAAGTVGIPAINTEGTKTTYSAAATVVPAAAATDIFTITGSATKTIRVTRIQISGQATTASPSIISLAKRSAAATGGTSTAPTVVPHDSGSAAGTATLLNYTVNPTPGALVGNIRSQEMVLVTAATPAVSNVPIVWDFTTRNSQGVVLRGIAQVLAINFGTATITGAVLGVDIEWTEE